MKTLRISLFITSLSIFLNHGYAREDFFAKIAGEPKVSIESDNWFNISIPFTLHNNPSQIALNGTRPSSDPKPRSSIASAVPTAWIAMSWNGWLTAFAGS